MSDPNNAAGGGANPPQDPNANIPIGVAAAQANQPAEG